MKIRIGLAGLSFLLVILISLSFSQKTYAQRAVGDFIGNTGDGIWIQDKLYLRDLLEAGIANNFWIGPDVDGILKFRAERLPAFMNQCQNALLRKLTDLNRHAPSLGDHLLSILLLYKFDLAEKTLDLQYDPYYFDQNPRVQLATRHLGRISIHAPSWYQLSAEHQAALLIHEAVYAVLRPVPLFSESNGPLKFYQPAEKVRNFIGHIFHPELEFGEPGALIKLVTQDLAITFDLANGPRKVLSWNLELWGPNSVVTELKLNRNQMNMDSKGKAHDLCEQLADMKDTPAGVDPVLVSTVDLPAYTLEFSKYSASFMQNYYKIYPNFLGSQWTRQVHRSEGIQACLRLLNDDWDLFESAP